MPGNGFVDMSGKRIGMLTVLPEYKLVNHRYYWKCQCDCGSDPVYVAGQYLRYGIGGKPYLDCGCVSKKNKEYAKERHKREKEEHDAKKSEFWAKEKRVYSRTKNGKRAFIKTVDRKTFEDAITKNLNGIYTRKQAAKACGLSEPIYYKRLSQYFFEEECGKLPKEFFGLEDDANKDKMELREILKGREEETHGALPASMLPRTTDFQ